MAEQFDVMPQLAHAFLNDITAAETIPRAFFPGFVFHLPVLQLEVLKRCVHATGLDPCSSSNIRNAYAKKSRLENTCWAPPNLDPSSPSMP